MSFTVITAHHGTYEITARDLKQATHLAVQHGTDVMEVRAS